jgi:hypothetical protein
MSRLEIKKLPPPADAEAAAFRNLAKDCEKERNISNFGERQNASSYCSAEAARRGSGGCERPTTYRRYVKEL